ncbi:MAG TPA: FtsX-like permease family protein [Capsulimonadaceae bacterium]|nr:FtsX-like permease family protein [Capsulimonadaceae bacterium]
MHSFLQLSLANLGRRRLRTLITVSGVALAAATMFCLITFQRGYQAGLKSELDKLGAHLLVVPKGCPYDAASIALHGASWPCYLKMFYLKTVRSTPHVAVAAPVLMNAVYDQKTGAQDVYCGVQPDILALKKEWRIDGAFPGKPNDILVGSEMAKESHWHVGETVAMPGLDNPVNGRICGIIAPTQGADDLFIYMSLTDAQKVFHRPGQLTHILVRLDDPDNLDQVVNNLRGCDAGLQMNVVPLAHLFQTIQNLVNSTRLLLGCVALVALLAAAAGVSNTLFMAVVERTREIGVLRALGASRGDIFRLLCAESAMLTFAGAAVGIVAAIALGRSIEDWLRGRLPYAPQGTLLHPEISVVAACLIGSIALGCLAALTPAWRASRLSPALAVRLEGGA